MLTKYPITALVPALIIALSVTGCAATAEPVASPTVEPSPSETPTPTVEPEPELALPTCDTMFSPDMVATLTAEGRVPDTDSSIGPFSRDEGVKAVFGGLTELVSCDWALPNSESGSTSTIAFIDDSSIATLQAAFAAGGFTASTLLGGELYSIEIDNPETNFSSESHLIVDGVWISTVYFAGFAQPLTLDAAGQLFP